MARDHAETPVVLSRIYTRTGDDGSTGLGDGSRAAKTDPRLAAYADVDEANAAIGVAITLGGLPDGMAALLGRIQNELFDVGADLCTPVTAEPAYPPLRITESYVTALEQACDQWNEGLPVLRSFVLPGGTTAAAQLHVARTIARRGELTALEADVKPLARVYLNRISDLLFIFARRANQLAGRDEPLWRPGA